MDTEKARALVVAHNNRDQALANLRNASAMAGDDTRAESLLEEAGDAYAVAIGKLIDLDLEVADAAQQTEAAAEAGAETPE